MVYTTLWAIVYDRLSVGTTAFNLVCLPDIHLPVPVYVYARYCDSGGHCGGDLTARDC